MMTKMSVIQILMNVTTNTTLDSSKMTIVEMNLIVRSLVDFSKMVMLMKLAILILMKNVMMKI